MVGLLKVFFSRVRYSLRTGELLAVAPAFGWGRKVRTPTGGMLANGEARRRDGKCNRE